MNLAIQAVFNIPKGFSSASDRGLARSMANSNVRKKGRQTLACKKRVELSSADFYGTGTKKEHESPSNTDCA